ncbi:hypothetical protein O181_101720 [Austropuccinia psidii MF-1]|uniref:Reverse transcriptase Ty1/copia-type domain-containing protein n=1 Tax=Austropuccinia psidii MF-1 TaxID=1389203 RepID=A0A9Q3JEZ8_9BASI|nr:hypothetical protein [Austropuccinia psidii MF-1]
MVAIRGQWNGLWRKSHGTPKRGQLAINDMTWPIGPNLAPGWIAAAIKEEGQNTWTSGDPCFVFLHMDDLVIGGRNMQVFKLEIVSTFEMKDLGELKYVLGMNVTQNRSMRTISLFQELYVANLLKDFGMQDCKPGSTPLVPSLRLDPISSSNADPTNINYRRGVGLLNYLVSCARPDIAFAVSCLAQFLNAPSVEHEKTFKHVLRYLKGTKSWGITLGDVCDNSLITVFCDVDWGSNYDSRSFSGSCVFCYGLVGWKTSKQEVVALSSTEAEYRSISSCCQDISWLLELTNDFGLALKGKLLCDNQGALSLLKNLLYQHRTRYIKLQLHWCRELFNERQISAEYVSTPDMVADIMTKSLPRQTHSTHCASLTIHDVQH